MCPILRGWNIHVIEERAVMCRVACKVASWWQRSAGAPNASDARNEARKTLAQHVACRYAAHHTSLLIALRPAQLPGHRVCWYLRVRQLVCNIFKISRNARNRTTLEGMVRSASHLEILRTAVFLDARDVWRGNIFKREKPVRGLACMRW